MPAVGLQPTGLTRGADQALDIGLHQNLQHSFRHGAQEIALAALLQQLDKRHSVVGHRILDAFGGAWKFHLSAPFR